MLCVAGLSAALIAADELRRPQHMWIMNLVWPVTGLFGSLLWVWVYFRYGRVPSRGSHRPHEHGASAGKPAVLSVVKATSHCGSGCALGDLCAEWLAFAVPSLPVALGWHTVFTERIYAVWILDFGFAYLFGMAFQYFTIAPMRRLTLAQGLIAALKADTLSLCAWQVGMYGFMAFASFAVFRGHLGMHLTANSAEFWFMMQLAMLAGFCTAYPLNWWLLRRGVKEAM
jgi:hypothetical protein